MENNLEIDVRKAKELGLSYGQYKALTYNPNAVPVKKAETGKPCPVCGGIIKPPRFKFCSDECAEIRKDQLRRAKNKKGGGQ